MLSKFHHSDFFVHFLESSETYADPSLNEIGAKLKKKSIFFSKKLIENCVKRKKLKNQNIVFAYVSFSRKKPQIKIYKILNFSGE